MGIHDLLPFLRKNASNSFLNFNEWFKTKNKEVVKVAIDVPIFMYKFCYGVGTGLPLTARMLKFNEELKERNIDPIFVFDGENLEAKKEEKIKRFQNSVRQFELKVQKMQFVTFISSKEMEGEDIEEFEVDRTVIPNGRPTKEDFEALKLAFQISNIEYKVAKFEAEALCSKLCKDNVVDAIITEDSDALAYLCDSVIINWNNDKEEVVNAQKAFQDLNITADQFQDFCVLLGNDFSTRIQGYGPVKAFKLLQKHYSLENILSLNLVTEENKERMKLCKVLFTSNCYEN